MQTAGSTKGQRRAHLATQGCAVVAMTATLVAGLEPAVIVAATAAALGAGRLTDGFGAGRLSGAPRRSARSRASGHRPLHRSRPT